MRTAISGQLLKNADAQGNPLNLELLQTAPTDAFRNCGDMRCVTRRSGSLALPIPIFRISPVNALERI
jgi:hypothetical protein